MKIAKNMIQLRESIGWSQSELARRAGITSSAICQLEKGDRSPTLDVAIKIVKALKVSLDELAGLEKIDKIEALQLYREFYDIEELTHADKELLKSIIRRLQFSKKS